MTVMKVTQYSIPVRSQFGLLNPPVTIKNWKKLLGHTWEQACGCLTVLSQVDIGYGFVAFS